MQRGNQYQTVNEIELNPDWNLKCHGTKYHYWYSVGDMMTISYHLRSQYLRYQLPEWMDENINMGDLYSCYRMNEDRIFLCEPYAEDNIEESFMQDFLKIYNEWGENFPNQYIFLLIAHAHWRSVRIIFNMIENSVDILWDDPYGGECFPLILKDKIINIIREIFTFFIHTEVIVYEVTKIIDQQGLGINGWDCGPISLHNVENYLINIDIQNIDIDQYLIINHQFQNNDWIKGVRKTHITISMGDDYVGQEILFENPIEGGGNESQSGMNQSLLTSNMGSNTELVNSSANTWWLATLNVRSLGNRKLKVSDNMFHNLPEYLYFFKKNNFKIIAIQETRVLGKCEQKGIDFAMYCSGGNGKAEYGVGIVVCNQWVDNIFHMEFVNEESCG